MSDNNLIPEICKLLGVKVGEKFKIRHSDEEIISLKTYVINERGLLKSVSSESVEVASINIAYLLNGEFEIIKLPWKPKKNEEYFSFYSETSTQFLCIGHYVWEDYANDFAKYKAGWVFKTQGEANDALPAIAKEFNVGYIGLD